MCIGLQPCSPILNVNCTELNEAYSLVSVLSMAALFSYFMRLDHELSHWNCFQMNKILRVAYVTAVGAEARTLAPDSVHCNNLISVSPGHI